MKYTGQIVAMKFISKQNKSEKDMRNLRGEIEILRTLNHPNIVLMLDVFETTTDFCVVMEYCQVCAMRSFICISHQLCGGWAIRIVSNLLSV